MFPRRVRVLFLSDLGVWRPNKYCYSTAAADSWARVETLVFFFIRARVYIVQERGHLIYYLIEGVFYDIESKQTKERDRTIVSIGGKILKGLYHIHRSILKRIQ